MLAFIIFLIPTGLCIFMFFYYNRKIDALKKQIYAYVKTVDNVYGKKYADTKQNTDSKE